METITGGAFISTSVSMYSQQILSTREVGETIEMVYKEVSNVNYLVYPSLPIPPKVYKVVYSCKEGKWDKSEKIYGKIIPAQEESYKF